MKNLVPPFCIEKKKLYTIGGGGGFYIYFLMKGASFSSFYIFLGIKLFLENKYNQH